jgi:hypothetical protein
LGFRRHLRGDGRRRTKASAESVFKQNIDLGINRNFFGSFGMKTLVGDMALSKSKFG